MTSSSSREVTAGLALRPRLGTGLFAVMPRKAPTAPAVPLKPFAAAIEECADLPSALVVLEQLEATLQAAPIRQSLQRSLGHFSDWFDEARYRHAPIDAALHTRALAVLARLTELSSEPPLPNDLARLHENLDALRDA